MNHSHFADNVSRELARIPVRAGGITIVSSDSGSGSGGGCNCCQTYFCMNRDQESIGVCAGCPNGAAFQYNLTLGAWGAYPGVGIGGNVTFTNGGAICSSSSSTGGDPCTWYSCPFTLASITSSSSSISGTYIFQLTFALVGGISKAVVSLVFVSGTDWLLAGSGIVWFASRDGFNCRCESPLYPIDASIIPQPAGLNYSPCLAPVIQYRCCCNCFQCVFPGITVTGSGSNASLLSSLAGGTTILFNQVQALNGAISVTPDDLACTPFWTPGSLGSPNPHTCYWGSWKAPDGHYPAPPSLTFAATPVANLFVTTYYPPMSVADNITVNISYNDVSLSGFHYATNASYACPNWLCEGGVFSFVSQGGISPSSNLCVNVNSSGVGFTPDGTVTCAWPPTLTLTPTACPSTSSSSSSS